MTLEERILGCLLGGAIGDALGYPVEFRSLAQIRAKYGAPGVRTLEDGNVVSDDTQMTLFTCEGLLRKGDPVKNIYNSYLRWLSTQGGRVPKEVCLTGGLMEDERLKRRRAPGMTCMGALAGGRMGRAETPLNHSKGCGGVMRVAPCAFFEKPFELARDAAAITHGHPSGFFSAGALSLMIHEIARGASLMEAVSAALARLDALGECALETANAMRAAVALAQSGKRAPEDIETLGGGWTGEEALAIALACALIFPDDFESALCLSVNHSGDSDSTGAICGNLLGAYLGPYAICAKWREGVEFADLIPKIANLLARAAGA